MIKFKAVILSVFLALVLFGTPSWANENIPDRFNVTVEVDFGPASKDSKTMEIEVARGTTAELAVKQLCSVEKGAACCDPREVSGIDGVGVDPASNRWWTVAINGSRNVSPYKTELKPDDYILWKYIENDQ